MCEKVLSKEPFMLKYYSNRYETQKIRDNVVDSYLLASKFVLDCFFTCKIIALCIF